jgi:transposase
MSQRAYSLDFKASAVKLVTEQGRGVKDVAASLGVPVSTMQYWVGRLGTPADAPPRPKADDDLESLRRENDRLREENRRLTMEREILKKATAFFAGEQA